MEDQSVKGLQLYRGSVEVETSYILVVGRDETDAKWNIDAEAVISDGDIEPSAWEIGDEELIYDLKTVPHGLSECDLPDSLTIEDFLALKKESYKEREHREWLDEFHLTFPFYEEVKSNNS